MCKTIALSTVATFTYMPDINLLKKNYAKSAGIKLDKLTKVEDWDAKATSAEKNGVENERKLLQAIED